MKYLAKKYTIKQYVKDSTLQNMTGFSYNCEVN